MTSLLLTWRHKEPGHQLKRYMYWSFFPDIPFQPPKHKGLCTCHQCWSGNTHAALCCVSRPPCHCPTWGCLWGYIACKSYPGPSTPPSGSWTESQEVRSSKMANTFLTILNDLDLVLVHIAKHHWNQNFPNGTQWFWLGSSSHSQATLKSTRDHHWDCYPGAPSPMIGPFRGNLTRCVDRTPPSDVTPVTIRYIQPAMVTQRSQSWSWMIDFLPFHSMSICPLFPEIRLLTLKIQAQGHSSRSHSGFNILLAHIPFIPF